ncbi:MAG TPA: hypothetical protein VNY30_08910 [Bryobacteraceae bacterium]|nr:hypothetical protein [Bryobacteraceae bacterium]
MIITRTPFRVSFAGGGSDLSSYYSREPGVVLSTAINKHMYIAVKEHFERKFFTGDTRDARQALAKQQAATPQKLPVLRRMCGIAREMREILTSSGDLGAFGPLLHESWEAKRSLSDSVSNPRIDELYERALRAGALGGKLLGAGGGGFLLLFCEPQDQGWLREALSDLRELPFSLDPQGSKIVHVGSERD